VSFLALHRFAVGNGLALLLGLAAVAAIVDARRRVRGTTLVAPLTWALFSLLSVIAMAGTEASRQLSSGEHWRYLAAVTTLTPFVALLGAKRPQNRAWQLIVASLLGLLWLQSLRAVLLDPSLPPLPHAAWRWFLAVILAAELANYLPTRHAFTAVVVFGGQACLLSGQLPLVPEWFHPAPVGGLGLIATGILLATALGRRPRRGLSLQDAAWLRFRDAFGALWALRVAERVNALARLQGWATHLGWQGFRPVTGKAADRVSDEPATAAVEQAFSRILWRFHAQQRPDPADKHLPASE
jgi:hypothetical protein